MSPAEFSTCYENTLMAVEDAIELIDSDIDFETVNKILTIIFPDDSQVIITPQGTTNQLWVAARSGGFHFAYDDNIWSRTTDKRPLAAVLNDIFEDQGGLSFAFAM